MIFRITAQPIAGNYLVERTTSTRGRYTGFYATAEELDDLRDAIAEAIGDDETTAARRNAR